jgi:hypothetical protein
MKIDCAYDELIEINSPKIIPNPRNPNRHPEDQIERLSKVIEYQGQRHPLIISKRSGFLVVGHGRLEAIKKLGWKQIAVSYQDFETEAQEYSFVVSDNAIASWAELDLSAINTEMLDLGPDFDIDLLGIKDFSLEPMEKFELSDEDEAEDLSLGAKKAIMIEFEPEHYKEAYELVKFWRGQTDVGLLILSYLRGKKNEIN